MGMCTRGGEDLIQAAQMNRKQEINNWKELGSKEAAGDASSSSFLPSPSTTSQVRMSHWAV